MMHTCSHGGWSISKFMPSAPALTSPSFHFCPSWTYFQSSPSQMRARRMRWRLIVSSGASWKGYVTWGVADGEAQRSTRDMAQAYEHRWFLPTSGMLCPAAWQACPCVRLPAMQFAPHACMQRKGQAH